MIRIVALQILLLVLSTTLYAQPGSSGDAFKDHLRAREKERKNAVKEYAAQHKVPISGTGANGEFMYLHHIADGTPVYYTTRGDENIELANTPSNYIKMGSNDWMPIDNNIRLQKMDNSYLHLKANKGLVSVYMLNGEGKFFYKSKKLTTKELLISTRKMDQDEYVLYLKTEGGTYVYNIFIQ